MQPDSILLYRLWKTLSRGWEVDLQSATKAIFTSTRVWLKVFFQRRNAKVEINGYLMFAHPHIVKKSSYY